MPIVLQLPVEDIGVFSPLVDARILCPGLVRDIVLRQHAGEFPVAALWTGGVLSEIRCTILHYLAGYFPGLHAVHRYPVGCVDVDPVLPGTDHVFHGG